MSQGPHPFTLSWIMGGGKWGSPSLLVISRSLTSTSEVKKDQIHKFCAENDKKKLLPYHQYKKNCRIINLKFERVNITSNFFTCRKGALSGLF